MDNRGTLKHELRDAIVEGDLAQVKLHFDTTDLASSGFGGSPLHYAASYGTLEMVRFFVDHGADINLRGGTFDAPAVTYAADSGFADITQYLVEKGSVLDTSHALRNPLLRVASEGHLKVVEYLLTTKIDLHSTYRIPTGALVNALVESEQNGHNEISELLKAHGCRRPIEGVDKPIWEPPPEMMIN